MGMAGWQDGRITAEEKQVAAPGAHASRAAVPHSLVFILLILSILSKAVYEVDPVSGNRCAIRTVTG